MRARIVLDSATPDQAYNATLAFQRTRAYVLPDQPTKEPTVQVLGTAMTWTSPFMSSEQALAMMTEFESLESEDRYEQSLEEERP